jgi:predicted unusual protein kinase regulating ubiquinone biosynthesis (AarF/ABC1/UbiB family)
VRYLAAVAVAALVGGGGGAAVLTEQEGKAGVSSPSAAAAVATLGSSDGAAGNDTAPPPPPSTLEAAVTAASDAARLAYLIPTRLARDIAAAAAIVADYRSELSKADAALAKARADLAANTNPLASEAVAHAEAARRDTLHGCHQRGADRLLQLCFDNGGVYVKLGQHVGQLDHLLPGEYVQTMRKHLLDRCPASSLDAVRRVVERDLGAPPEQLFSSFSRDAVASASLAQVHRATSLPDPITGQVRTLAVKVQHPGLRESCAADIAMIGALVKAARAFFPDFDLQWLVDEVEHNLPLELDFRHEALNAARCAANLRSSRSRLPKGKVVVPEVVPELSSARVLTMEWIEGASLGDSEALDALRADRREVSLLVARTFNEMIFTFGDLHADPHAANLLVRRVGGRTAEEEVERGAFAAGNGGSDSRQRRRRGSTAAASSFVAGKKAVAAAQQAEHEAQVDPSAPRRRHLERLRDQHEQGGHLQLVLLDHGLYRRVDSAFRLRYAALWRALIFADEPAIREHAKAMGAGHAVPLFAGMLTQRPWHAVVGSASQFEADSHGNPLPAPGGNDSSSNAPSAAAAAASSPPTTPNELDGSYDPVAAANPAAAAALKAAAAAKRGGRGASAGLDRLSLPRGQQEREVLQAYAAHYGKEIGTLLGKLPRELLLLLKTNDCLRSVDASLGNPVNTYAVTARECCRALAEARREQNPGWASRASAAADALGVEARMGAMSALTWWYAPRRRKEEKVGGGEGIGGVG